MLHLVAIPGQPVSRANSSCAYTSKAWKFARMMDDVTVYSAEDSEVGVPVYPDIEFSHDLPWPELNRPVIEAIRERAEPGDYVLSSFGAVQADLVETGLPVVEYGIGYGGTFADFRVFESYAWMHHVYGYETARRGGDSHSCDGRFYDAVIPNYFDTDDFPEGGGGDYLLYVGRLTQRKGLEIVIETAKQTGLPLVVAGAGEYPLPDWVDYRGSVGPDERAELMGNARALIAPTLYLEPFGGVVVEAQLCGTPVITTDWGAFPETVEEGVTGYRCRLLREFVAAAHDVDCLDRPPIRERAVSRYSLASVRPQYERYFRHLDTLRGDGFYDLNERTTLALQGRTQEGNRRRPQSE